MAPDHWLKSLRDNAIALVVPPTCAACREALPASSQICATCERQLDRLPTGRPVSRAQGPVEHFAAYPLVAPARELVHALKYRSATSLAAELAALIALRAPRGLADADAIVPAPAHPAQRRRRGFDQSVLLADRLGEIWSIPVVDCLLRDGHTPPQTGQSRAGRMTLDGSAITVRPRAELRLPGSKARRRQTKVLVLDDVATTGVTLEVCTEAIREEFRSEVRAVTFASAGTGPGWHLRRRVPKG